MNKTGFFSPPTTLLAANAGSSDPDWMVCSRDEAARQGGQRPPVPDRLTGHIWPDGGTGPDEDGSAILSLPPAGDE